MKLQIDQTLTCTLWNNFSSKPLKNGNKNRNTKRLDTIINVGKHMLELKETYVRGVRVIRARIRNITNGGKM